MISERAEKRRNHFSSPICFLRTHVLTLIPINAHFIVRCRFKSSVQIQNHIFYRCLLSLIYFHRRVNLSDESTCPGVSKGPCVNKQSNQYGVQSLRHQIPHHQRAPYQEKSHARPPANRPTHEACRTLGGGLEVAR